MDRLQTESLTWYWKPMGREGSILRELTKTKEMALAWAFRATLGALVSLAVWVVWDLRNESEKAWERGGARMDRIELRENEMAGDIKVIKQIIPDKAEQRDKEIRDIDRRLNALENRAK